MHIDIKQVYKIEFAAVAVALLVFIIFDVSPQMSKAFALMQKIQEARKTARALPATEKEKIRQQLMQERQSLDDSFQVMRGAVGAVREKFSSEKNIPKVILTLEELAAASGIDLLSIKPLTTESQGTYESTGIVLEFQCEYAQLVKFLSQWGSTPFYITAQELSIAEAGAMTKKLTVHLTVKGIFKNLNSGKAGSAGE